MAEYDFPYTDSSVYNASGPDDWSSTSYILDHVCRPVIIDAEGRKRPIVSYGPQQNSDIYVTRTETIVKEHFLSPFASEHKHTPYTSPEGYGYAEERWQKPSGPVNSRLEKTDESHTRVQTEASKPRFDPFSQANWRKTTTSPGFSGNTGGQSSEFNDLSNHDWQKSGGNAYQNDNFDDYFSKHSSAMEPSMVTHGGWGRPNHNTRNAYRETVGIRESTPTEPAMITHGRWVRPSPKTWASPPDYILSKPTNDINTAVGIMKEAAKPSFSPAPNSKPTNDISRRALEILEEAVKRPCCLLAQTPGLLNLALQKPLTA
ncbi:conserved hypothetical protein [Ricinus communis]|uniref:Uncharacterized protein n=1 Tax=Ricinus communis TaxID=3988 RepID=B9REV3_RICCO|nr:conserved hypothetical protein [Ricinus communis]